MGQTESSTSNRIEEEQSQSNAFTLIRSISLDHEEISVFEHTPWKFPNTILTAAAQNSHKHLRILRHPNILHFQWDQIDSAGSISIITDPVIPLSKLPSPPSKQDLTLGLHSILSALVFLHDKCKLVHNNVARKSVFVSEDDMSWLLGGFEFAQSPSAITPQYLSSTREYRAASAILPEDGTPKEDHSTSRDIVAFCKLAIESLDDLAASDDDGNIASFVTVCKHLSSNADRAAQSSAAALLGHAFFLDDEWVGIITTLDSLTVKSRDVKEQFFSTLAQTLKRFSPSTVGQHLIKRLFAAPLFQEESFPRFMMELMTVGQVLEEPYYTKFIIPAYLKLFSSRDSRIRIVILDCLASCSGFIAKDVLLSKIVHEVQLGIDDLNDLVVAASLRALAVLVVRCSGDIAAKGARRAIFEPNLQPLSRPVDPCEIERKPSERLSIKSLAPLASPIAKASSSSIQAPSAIITSKAGSTEAIDKDKDARKLARQQRNEELKKKLEAKRLGKQIEAERLPQTIHTSEQSSPASPLHRTPQPIKTGAAEKQSSSRINNANEEEEEWSDLEASNDPPKLQPIKTASTVKQDQVFSNNNLVDDTSKQPISSSSNQKPLKLGSKKSSKDTTAVAPKNDTPISTTKDVRIDEQETEQSKQDSPNKLNTETTAEPDLFADMEPEVATRHTKPFEKPVSSNASTLSLTTEPTSVAIASASSTFAVIQNPDDGEEDGGWGEEIDIEADVVAEVPVSSDVSQGIVDTKSTDDANPAMITAGPTAANVDSKREDKDERIVVESTWDDDADFDAWEDSTESKQSEIKTEREEDSTAPAATLQHDSEKKSEPIAAAESTEASHDSPPLKDNIVDVDDVDVPAGQSILTVDDPVDTAAVPTAEQKDAKDDWQQDGDGWDDDGEW